jgi:hypothetical protein
VEWVAGGPTLIFFVHSMGRGVVRHVNAIPIGTLEINVNIVIYVAKEAVHDPSPIFHLFFRGLASGLWPLQRGACSSSLASYVRLGLPGSQRCSLHFRRRTGNRFTSPLLHCPSHGCLMFSAPTQALKHSTGKMYKTLQRVPRVFQS